MLTSVGLAVALPAILLASAPASEPPECLVVNSYGRCVVTAVDPGRSVAPAKPAPSDGPDRWRPEAERSRSDAPAPPPPRPSMVSLPTGDGGWVQTPTSDLDALLDALPAEDGPAPAPAAPPVTPELLAARAVELLTLQPPVLRTSVSTTGFVGLPVWLWIDGGDAATGPVSATASAGTAQVTATGRLAAVEWAMGPAGELVRCTGPGTPWTGQEGPSPDCGYVYALRSLPERTEGTGAWTVTATALWTVSWSGISGGEAVEGEQSVAVPASTSLPVGEVQVLVGGGDR